MSASRFGKQAASPTEFSKALGRYNCSRIPVGRARTAHSAVATTFETPDENFTFTFIFNSCRDREHRQPRMRSLRLLYAATGSDAGDAIANSDIVHEPDFTISAVLLTGLKFPTGDSSRIKEEFHEINVPGAPESGIHGHDLTLGTGSYDGIFGEQTSLRYKNAFFEADVQFTLRGDGTHQYHFANDLTWSGGPGYYFIRRQDMIIGLQFVASGEYKDVDRFRGKPADDTGITSVFLGPRLIASRGRFSAEIAAELPVSIDNTALQVVPDYRLRGALSFHF